jgi:DNA-binding GntR family transcriptional regulator
VLEPPGEKEVSMADEVTEEIKTQIIDFFKQKNKMLTSRDVASGLNLENRVVKKALTELVNAGLLEFTSFGGATFIKLPEGS